MNEVKAMDKLPEVALLLEIASLRKRVLDPADPLRDAIGQEISRRLAEVMETLGIPGVPAVRIAALDADSTRFLRVHVNGRLCRYPDELLRLVYGYVSGERPDPDMTLSHIFARFGETAAGEVEADGGSERLVEFLSLVCLEAVKRRPSVLLGLEQAAAYGAALPNPSVEPDLPSHPLLQQPACLRSILRGVLNLKISIADQQTVAAVLARTRDRSPEDVVEELVVALCPDSLEIQLPPEYLRQMTRDHANDGPGLFTFLREGMFQELGMTYPRFRFVLNNDLKPNCFAFKVNHLTMLPSIGLQPGQCLVNDTAQRLGLLNIEATAAINPATGQPASLIGLQYKDLADSSGLTTWDQLGYLILSFAEILRRDSACLVHRKTVQSQMKQLESAFPALVQAARTRMSDERITRVLRSLVAEEISIRNLRLILERLLDHDRGFGDSSGRLGMDDRPAADGQSDATRQRDLIPLVSFVRAGLKRQIGTKYARGTRTLVAYLIDLEIKRLVFKDQSLRAGEKEEGIPDEGAGEKILDVIRREVAMLPPTAAMPSILTSMDVRPYLRQIVASEFPRASVVAYQELASDLNVQPVARISLTP